MREVELKALVPDLERLSARLRDAGAALEYDGRLEDCRWDTPDRALLRQDHVLRTRVYRTSDGVRASLDWKGPTTYDGGYKVREELSSPIGDPDVLLAMLGRLGYVPTREIDRHITQYLLNGAVVRIERYPRMDDLVEVEGAPDAIEAAIAASGIPRPAFTADRLPDFARRFEARTGTRAALCDRELAGDWRFAVDDA